MASSSSEAPRPLSLSGHPKETLVRSRALLARHATPEEMRNLRLGGGTALAMRWKHRHSTDIDYAMDVDVAEAFVDRSHGAMTADLRELVRAGAIKRKFLFAGRSASWHYVDSGPVSISASLRRADPEVMDWEAETGTLVVSTFEILRGKLLGRVLNGNRLLVRDGYDMCCAFLYAPEEIASLVRLARRQRGEDMERMFDLVVGTRRRIIVGRPLQDAVHEDIAHNPWRLFMEQALNVPAE